MWRHLMMIHTYKRTVTFRQPFTLKSIDEVLPAGAYTVETDEEPLTGISFLGYRRIQTLLHLPGKPGQTGPSRLLTIDPNELDAALRYDQVSADASVFEGPENNSEKLKTIPQRQVAEDNRAIERAEDEGMMVHSK